VFSAKFQSASRPRKTHTQAAADRSALQDTSADRALLRSIVWDWRHLRLRSFEVHVAAPVNSCDYTSRDQETTADLGNIPPAARHRIRDYE